MSCNYTKPCDDCNTRQTFEPCGDMVPCSACSGGEAPCAFQVLFGCQSLKGGLWTQPLTLLWLECLHDCERGYTARKCNPEAEGAASTYLGCGIGGASSPVDDDLPVNGTATCDDPEDELIQEYPPVCRHGNFPDLSQVGSYLNFGCDPMYDRKANRISLSPCDTTSGYLIVQPAYRCGWYDFYDAWEVVDSGGDPAYPPGTIYRPGEVPCDGPAGPFPNFSCTPDERQAWLDANTIVTWKLTPDGTLAGYDEQSASHPLPVVTYSPAGSFSCTEPTTLTMDGEFPHPDYPSLPYEVCVGPYSANWNSWCDTKEHAQACGDSGWNNICLSASAFSCGAVAGPDGPMMRNFSPGLPTFNLVDLVTCAMNYYYGPNCAGGTYDLSSCELVPEGPCYYFGPVIGISNDTAEGCQSTYCNTIVMTVHCDGGGDWHLRVICLRFHVTQCTFGDARPQCGCVPDESLCLADGYACIELERCTLLCDATGVVSQKCPDGARFEFECESFADDCCPNCVPNVPCDCCEDGYPATLYLTYHSDDCPEINQVITLVNTSSNCNGLGDSSWTSGGTELHIATGTCTWVLDGGTFGGIGSATCPFTPVVVNGVCLDEDLNPYGSSTITLSA